LIDVIERLGYLREIAGTQQHADLIAVCVDRLHLIGLSRQVDTLESALNALVETTATQRGAV